MTNMKGDRSMEIYEREKSVKGYEKEESVI